MQRRPLSRYCALTECWWTEMPIATSDKYKRYAVTCLVQSRTQTDERERAFLIEMAQTWQKLADQATANDNLQAAPVADEPDRGD
jgi:hypothetical protein